MEGNPRIGVDEASVESVVVLSRGQTLQKRYQVQHALGRGGMGSVFLAVDKESGRSVAVKVLHADSEAAIRQFEIEGRILRELQHPNLPKVHGLFREFDVNYLVMDFIPGKALDDVLQSEGKGLDEARVLAWARQLCDVLEYMHDHNPPVIFRDLKPSNLMLIEGDRMKLIDFGIAKIVEQEGAASDTQTVARGVGSRGFAAPEQYGGGTDAQSDIYSFGATLYCLLSGTIPPDSVDVATGRGTKPDLRAARPDISDGMVRAVEAMMTVDRSRRPASIAKVRELLNAIKKPSGPRSAPAEPAAGRRAAKTDTGSMAKKTETGAMAGKSDTGSIARKGETGRISGASKTGDSGRTEKPTSTPRPKKEARRIDIGYTPWVGRVTIVFVVVAVVAGLVALFTLRFTAPREGADAAPGSGASKRVAAASSTPSAAPSAVALTPSATPSSSPTASGPRVVMATPVKPRPVATPTPSPTPTPTPEAPPSAAPSKAASPSGDDGQLPAGQRPTVPNSWRITAGEKVGQIALGAPVDDFAKYGHPVEMNGKPGVLFSRMGMALGHDNGKITRITLLPLADEKRNRLYHTDAGIVVGDPATRVIDEFGPPPAKSPYPEGVDWRYPKRGISFRLKGETIAAIEVFAPQP